MIRVEVRTHGASPCKPRASGDDPVATDATAWASSVNPARVGMILVLWTSSMFSLRKPRASGDDPSVSPQAALSSL